MDRRVFLCGLTLAATITPCSARAQQAAKVYRVGVLASSTEANFEPSVKVFREALQAAGWLEGRNLTLDVRYPGEQAANPSCTEVLDAAARARSFSLTVRSCGLLARDAQQTGEGTEVCPGSLLQRAQSCAQRRSLPPQLSPGR